MVKATWSTLLLLALSFGAPRSTAHMITPPNAPDDPFQCYRTKTTKGTPKFQSRDVALSDWIESGNYTVRKARAICLPALTPVGAVMDPNTYLESYQVKPASGEPKHVRQTAIEVENLFGHLFLDTKRVDRLLIPTASSMEHPLLEAPDPNAHAVDLYKCYRVKVTKGTPKFQRQTISVEDAFEDRIYELRKPTRLCVPSGMGGGGMKNVDGHLVCYQAKPSSGQPAHTKRSPVYARNEFGPESLDTKKEEELCVLSVLVNGDGCSPDDTFSEIQNRIFTPSCALASCHGPFAQGGLDLQTAASFPELINVPAENAAAQAAGKLRVVPGDAAASFLSQKLRGLLEPGEGGQMPVIGTLSAVELDLIDAWIDAGAPQAGSLPGVPCLPEEEYEPAPPLTPPAGGYQIVLTGPTLQPGEQEEGCYWIPAPNPTDFNVGKWEFSLNPGTHHFSIFEWERPGVPVTGVWTPNDFGCFSGTEFGDTLTGSPQAPYYVDTYPPGVARVLTAGSYLGLNAHYFNEFDVPIQIKVWINVYPYNGTPDHISQTIIALDDTFSISIPPFTIETHPPPGSLRARWSNDTGQPVSVISLAGHMHQNGVRFTIWDQAGTKLYESFDWSHPQARIFDPPLVLPAGSRFDYECLYDNGVNRPLRVNGLGQPTNLIFGVSAEAAMCILTGQYYPD